MNKSSFRSCLSLFIEIRLVLRVMSELEIATSQSVNWPTHIHHLITESRLSRQKLSMNMFFQTYLNLKRLYNHFLVSSP